MTRAVAFDLAELPGEVYRVSGAFAVAPEDAAGLVDVDCPMTRDAAAQAAVLAGVSGYTIKGIFGRTISSGWWVVALMAGAAV